MPGNHHKKRTPLSEVERSILWVCLIPIPILVICVITFDPYPYWEGSSKSEKATPIEKIGYNRPTPSMFILKPLEKREL